MPHNWNLQTPISSQSIENLSDYIFNNRVPDYYFHRDKNTGLITTLRIKEVGIEIPASVSLVTTGPLSGIYRSGEIRNLVTALLIQKFFAYYLNQLKESHYPDYPYIDGDFGQQWSSQDLRVPSIFEAMGNQITTDQYQDSFLYKAHEIAGQFGRKLNYVKFDDLGALTYVQIDSDDCNYHLGSFNRQYNSHNVDNPFQAATLHGIVAQYINDRLSSPYAPTGRQSFYSLR